MLSAFNVGAGPELVLKYPSRPLFIYCYSSNSLFKLLPLFWHLKLWKLLNLSLRLESGLIGIGSAFKFKISPSLSTPYNLPAILALFRPIPGAAVPVPLPCSKLAPRWPDVNYRSCPAVYAAFDAAAAACSATSLVFFDALELLWSILTAAWAADLLDLGFN